VGDEVDGTWGWIPVLVDRGGNEVGCDLRMDPVEGKGRLEIFIYFLRVKHGDDAPPRCSADLPK
jgi:hypothetical protein